MKFKEWIKNLGAQYHSAKEIKRNVMKEIQSCTALNVIEFGGSLYLSHNGVPIIKTDRLNMPVTDILDEARKEYLDWKEKYER